MKLKFIENKTYLNYERIILKKESSRGLSKGNPRRHTG